MANSDYKTDRAKIVGEVSSALFDLRDALMELSLALRDWQFETDLQQRRKNETVVQELLQKISANHGPGA